MLSTPQLLMLLLTSYPILLGATAVEFVEELEPRELGHLQDCADNGTICNPAELLHCIKGQCDCEDGTAWEADYNTCRPLNHEPPGPMSWGKIALIVGFSVAVLVMVMVFVIRKRMKETSFKPTLEERRQSVFAEAKGDIPMKHRKFSQHFA